MKRITIIIILFLTSFSLKSQIKDSSTADIYPQGLLGIRIHIGYPTGNMGNIYQTMPGLNVFYNIRFNKHFYAGLNTAFCPEISLSDVAKTKANGYFILTLSGRYAFDIEKDKTSLYIETGAGIYRTKNITGNNIYGKIFEMKTNPGFDVGTGFEGHFSRTVMLNFGATYNSYYDSRNGGNMYGFISAFAGMEFVIDY
ncbi:MAG: outer membrane beta-barrel protein [Bacteroidetes bacterium]|nr:outer membrane beta-barrel protein [Bacteroidota bacterium]